MQIAFHIGANCTDEDRLLKSMLRNAAALRAHGIAAPGPGKYRKLIREAIQALGGAPPAPDTRDVMIDAIVEDDGIDRLILANDNFIAIPKRIFDHAQLYPQAEDKARGLARIFDRDQISLFLGLRHPASFIQATALLAGNPDVQSHLGLMAVEDFSWADLIRRLKHGAPQAQLTVWCNEDSPLIWEDLLRAQSGLPSGVHIEGRFDALYPLLTQAGADVLPGIAEDADPATRQSLLADLLETQGDPDKLDEEMVLTGLTEDVVNMLGQRYEDDIAEIAAMDGVTLILPFE